MGHGLVREGETKDLAKENIKALLSFSAFYQSAVATCQSRQQQAK